VFHLLSPVHFVKSRGLPFTINNPPGRARPKGLNPVPVLNAPLTTTIFTESDLPTVYAPPARLGRYVPGGPLQEKQG